MIVFIFDTETTGLVKNSLVPLDSQPRIIEFYGHLVDDSTGETIEEIEFFCDPGTDLEPIITRITGITTEQVKGQPPFKSYSTRVFDMMGKADAVVAHNLSFDMAMVDNEFSRACEQGVCWPTRLICTVEQTEWMKGHRLSLRVLHEELFCEPFADAHRARNDVNALTKCYLELRKRGEL